MFFIRETDEIVHPFLLAYRPQILPEFTISISMEVGENEHQLVGFMELNGQDFDDKLEESYGM
jgi:hypothetical protein